MIVYWPNGLSGIRIMGYGYASDDFVIWAWDGSSKDHKTKVYWTAKGRAYFRTNGGSRVYLDECIRAR